MNFKYFLIIFISFLLAITGLFLIHLSYKKNIGLIAALSEINFLKNMPYLLSSDKINKLPIGHENLLLKENTDISIFAEYKHFNNKSSIWDVKFKIKYKNYDIIKLNSLFDTRIRK